VHKEYIRTSTAHLAPRTLHHAPCTTQPIMRDININDYDYDLPQDRIAQYPVKERDGSNLLIYKDGKTSKDIFRNICEYLPADSLLVFNNTRVIRARLLFRKESGAAIEILCLEPLVPSEYSQSFGSKSPVEWKCIVGNLKKWKSGKLAISFSRKNETSKLYAERLPDEGETQRIKFSWENEALSFGEVIELTGHIPLPPYINRGDEQIDKDRYQTVYSSIDGSVAAPTAGLHFTPYVFGQLKSKGLKKAEITLHVGAGTFKPVKSDNAIDHEMHCEHFSINKKTIELIRSFNGQIIPVGTTSVRTLESLYWIGVKLLKEPEFSASSVSLNQWEAYKLQGNVTPDDSLGAIIKYLDKENLAALHASTGIMIVPGYKFKIVSGLITNFHQPRSTLLLLISAFTGVKWKELYIFALRNNFRFLSYGDSSLLLK
jgi:S-adenosylmethionine:tRNA ribosyltransferase-isomerase